MKSSEKRTSTSSSSRSSRKPGGVHAPRETIILRASEIEVDASRNARRIRDLPSDDKRKNGRMTDGELEADIRARGLDTPVRVRLRPGNRWELVYGFRRHRACAAIDPNFPMLCTVQPLEHVDEVSLRVTHVAENVHRAALRGWELAEELWRLTRPPFGLTREQIATRLGYDRGYVSNLVRLRAQLAPELWAHWQAVGDSLPIGPLLEVASLPPAEQVAELESILRTRQPAGLKRKGAARLARPEELTGWITSLSHSATLAARSPDWIAGAMHALQATIKRVPW